MVFFDAAEEFPAPEVWRSRGGDYRRLIPGPSYIPPGANDHERIDSLRGLASGMGGSVPPTDEFNSAIPAAYTYLGQFVDHDVTYSSSSIAEEPGGRNRNRRTPGLDLDSLYAAGPSEVPQMYGGAGGEVDSPYVLRCGQAFFDERTMNPSELDLPRVTGRYARVATLVGPRGVQHYALVVENPGEGPPVERRVAVRGEDVIEIHGLGYVAVCDTNVIPTSEGWRRASLATIRTIGTRAIIGDPRNDENVLVSQLHLAFIRFHAFATSEVRKCLPHAPGAEVFVMAQRLVRWHYQWMIVHDYLRKILGDEQWETHSLALTNNKNVAYRWARRPYLPLEFVLAAFRFGHAMIRPRYRLNGMLPPEGVVIFTHDTNPAPKADLRGRRILPDGWSVQWDQFLSVNGSTPQFSRLITETLSSPIANLRVPVGATMEVLPFVTLLRGWQAGLTAGHDAARHFDVPLLDGDPLPLWFYILREAREYGGGRHLGPLGARIVGETLFGIVREHRGSYLHADKPWTPMWGREKGQFDLEDLIRCSGMPITEGDVRRQLDGTSPA